MQFIINNRARGATRHVGTIIKHYIVTIDTQSHYRHALVEEFRVFVVTVCMCNSS